MGKKRGPKLGVKLPPKRAKNPHQSPPLQRAQAQRRGGRKKPKKGKPPPPQTKKGKKPPRKKDPTKEKKKKKGGGEKRGGAKKRSKKVGLKKSPKGPNQGHRKTGHTPKKWRKGKKKSIASVHCLGSSQGVSPAVTRDGEPCPQLSSCHLTPAAPRPHKGQLLHSPALLRNQLESHEGGCHVRWPPHTGRVSSLLLSPKQARVAAWQGRPRRLAFGHGG